MDLVRLACVKHASSVRPEPGSNSPTKTCRQRWRLPRLTIDMSLSAVAVGMTGHCDLDVYYLLPPTGYVDGRIDRQVHLTRHPRVCRPEDLPALAFCLLFRFQGAEARAHLGGGVLPAWLGADRSSGGRSACRGAKRNVSRTTRATQPRLRKKLRPDGGTSCRSATAGTGRATWHGR